MTNTLTLDRLNIPTDALTYAEDDRAVGLDFTPPVTVVVPAGHKLHASRLWGAYTLGEGALFSGHTNRANVTGPAGVNAYIQTRILEAEGSLNAKPGYDRYIAMPGFVGNAFSNVSAGEYRTGMAYAGINQIALKPLDETAVLDTVRRVQHETAGACQIKVIDEFTPDMQVQVAFRKGFTAGPGAIDAFYDLAGNLRWGVTRDGVAECYGVIAKGPSEFRSSAKFINQTYAEFQNSAGRQFFLQAVLVGGVEYFRLLIGYVGEAVRFLLNGVELLGFVHANYNTSPPAGGSATVGIKCAGVGWYPGTGDPTLSAAVGSRYTDVSVPRDWKMTSTGWALA